MMRKKSKSLFHKIQLILLMIFGFGLMFQPPLQADPLYDDTEQFILNNPDGRKYEFVRVYLNALQYLKENSDHEKKLPTINIADLENSPSAKPIIDRLKRDNVNLRIARNLLENFDAQNNALILKVVNIFTRLCDDLIEYNQYDQALYEKISEVQRSGQFENFNKDGFLDAQKLLASQRRQAWKSLMEASMLINVVLVSTDRNYYGEFYRLGITQSERTKLLYKIDDFKGDGFSGGLEEGQTFLQGSVNVIRSILENDSWQVASD